MEQHRHETEDSHRITGGERTIYLSYSCRNDLFHVLKGQDGFDAFVAATSGSRYGVTDLVIDAECSNPDLSLDLKADLKPVALRIKVACIADRALSLISPEQRESIEQGALDFLSEAGRIGRRDDRYRLDIW
jgi:hypothetical protein